MSKTGLIIVVSGPSGVGKGTVIKRYLERGDANAALSVSWTTRAPRTGDGEKNGVHYWFKTREEFKKNIEAGGFLEYAQYVDDFYGTPKAPVEAWINEGKDVILEIDVEGASRIRQSGCKSYQIFIAPPSTAVLEARLRSRGTESEEKIQKRMRSAERELDRKDEYDYIMVNDDLDAAVCELAEIIKKEKEKQI